MKKKKKYRKKLKYTKRNQRRICLKLILSNEEMQDGVVVNPTNLRDFDNGEVKNREVSPYFYTFSKADWEGMITIKFYESAFSKDSDSAHSKRRHFLDFFMGNLKTRMNISHGSFQWIACEEFGSTGVGHFHVLFSLENLTQGKKDKMKITDFSESGDFLSKLRESAGWIYRESSHMPKKLDIHWSQRWENIGLVRYFCKIEHGRPEKHFILSKFHEKQGLIAAA
jgi:hypothetical protein